ncbi:MAG: hypothetical protein PHU27_05370 [Salinivirgaceae bacterium]|nr:hypothetical protein [Salinivirgaceae bacterium]
MDKINALLDFLGSVILITLGHLIWLLGLIFIFGLILYLLARFTRLTYVKSVGQKLDIVVTGWIGTPVHELGHAIFCILFRHKIVDIKLFNPDPNDGTLGYVTHSYNPNSTFQKIGNFFIGIGPILFGALVLYAALYYLMPDFKTVFTTVEKHSTNLAQDVQAGSWLGVWNAIKISTTNILTVIFNTDNLTNWRFWIFLYLSFCVASHMELSPPDISGVKGGLITMVVALLIFNLFILVVEAFGLNSYAGTFWQYIKLETYAPYINKVLGTLGALFVYAVIISGLNFIISFIVLSIHNITRRRGMINPFW